MSSILLESGGKLLKEADSDLILLESDTGTDVTCDIDVTVNITCVMKVLGGGPSSVHRRIYRSRGGGGGR